MKMISILLKKNHIGISIPCPFHHVEAHEDSNRGIGHEPNGESDDILILYSKLIGKREM